MSEEICATGFSAGQNGTYSEIDRDLWYNGEYYLYRDFERWMISDSPYRFERAEASSPGHLKATKTYTPGSSPATPTGDYIGVDGNNNGHVALGS
jgi:hypothetical protein